MTGPGSIQLRLYLRARPTLSRAEAADLAGIGIKEAEFTDRDHALGLLDQIDLAIPRRWVEQRLGVLAGTPLGQFAIQGAA